MFTSRRSRRSLSTPPAVPSPSALAAATTVYHPSSARPSTASLAAAAAGAALRNAAASPPPDSHRLGSIPTKRMLQRRGSYSSAASDPPSRSGSLTGRRFRGDNDSTRSLERADAVSVRQMHTALHPKPSSELPSRTGSLMGRRFRGDNGSTRSVGSADVGLDRQLHSTLRKPTSSTGGSMMSRGSLRGTPAVITPRRFSSSSDSSTGAQPLGFMHHQGEYTDSVTSFTSDLESIVEESRSRRRKRAPPPVAEDTDEERREEEEDKEMCRRERRRTLSKLESKRPYTPADDDGRAASLRASSQGAGSPTRAQFGDTLKLIRHSPLARSVSPAKSALKHPCSPSPEDGKRAHVRVSFSDEDSIASFSIMRPPVAIDVAPPPTLPVFSRVRKESQRGRTQEQDKRRRRSAVIVEPALSKVTSSEPVSTDDEGYDEDDDEVHKMVPEFVLTEPTPREEKQQSVQSTGEPEAPPAPTSVPGQFPASPPPEESDSEIDVFHDAFEMLPASGSKSNLLLPTITEMSGPAHPQLTRAPPSPPPQTPISTAPSSSISPRSLIPPMPPLPESFSKPTPIPSRRRSLTPPPRRRPARRAPLPPTQEILDDSESDTSVTSFRRTYARTRDSQGMRITMRAAQALTPVSSRQYSSSSDGEEEGARKMRRRLGLGIGIRKISAGSTSAGSVPVTGTWRSRFQDSSDEEGTTLPVPPPVPQTTPRRRVLRRKSSEGSGKGKLRKKSPARAEKVEKVEKTKEKDRRSIFAWVRSRSSSRSGAKLEETVVPPLPTQTPQLEAENVVVAVAEPPVEISTPETEVVAAPEITQTATAIAIATAPATKLPSSMTRPHLHLRSKLESVSFSPSTKSEDAGPAKKRGWKRIFGR